MEKSGVAWTTSQLCGRRAIAAPVKRPQRLVAIALSKNLGQGKATLIVHEGVRYACVRRGQQVDVLEDACPHEGHPLSMGVVRDGVLTCPWHNWKFELDSGLCTFGGESARRLHSEVIDGEVFVELTREASPPRERHEADLRRAIDLGSRDGIVRTGLRLAALEPLGPMGVLADVLARRSRHGVTDALAALAALIRLERAALLSAAEALALAAEVTLSTPLHGVDLEEPAAAAEEYRDAFLEALLEERRDEAVARAMAARGSFRDVSRTHFLPFASLKLFDRGLALVRVQAALFLAEELPALDGALRVATARMLSWAVAETDLPRWRLTRGALASAYQLPTVPVDSLAGFEEERLLGSERTSTREVLSALATGTPASLLLESLGRASLQRVATYDCAWSSRVESSVTIAEPVLAALFIAAARRSEQQLAVVGAPLAVIAAGFVGRLQRLAGDVEARAAGALRDALREVVFGSELGQTRRCLAILFADTLADEPDSKPVRGALGAVLREPRGAGLVRDAAHAERLVRTGKPPVGID